MEITRSMKTKSRNVNFSRGINSIKNDYTYKRFENNIKQNVFSFSKNLIFSLYLEYRSSLYQRVVYDQQEKIPVFDYLHFLRRYRNDELALILAHTLYYVTPL